MNLLEFDIWMVRKQSESRSRTAASVSKNEGDSLRILSKLFRCFQSSLSSSAASPLRKFFNGSGGSEEDGLNGSQGARVMIVRDQVSGEIDALYDLSWPGKT
jgi:hypothetical protein